MGRDGMLLTLLAAAAYMNYILVARRLIDMGIIPSTVRPTLGGHQ